MEFNPFSYEIHEDPYPTYRQLRDEAPVYHNAEIGFYALSRFADVWDATLDWKAFGSLGGEPLEGAVDAPLMIFMDPPHHTRLRKLVSKAFTPRRVSEMEPRIRALVCGYLDPLGARGACDIVKEFSARFPMDVISALLGIPEEDRDEVRAWSNRLMEREDRRAERPAASLEAEANLFAYFERAIAERRRSPRGDMMTALVEAEVEDDDGTRTRLGDPEILGFCNLLAAAGNETVTKLLGNAIVLLARHPAQRALLVKQPGRIPNAVEEILRYDPPSQYQGRVTTCELTLHGRSIPQGSRVLLLTGAACRDPREYDGADRLDLEREIPRQLGFGYGQHLCLGASLARLESRIALEEICARFPEYEVNEAGLERAHGSNLRGYSGVPIRYPEAGF